MYEFADQVALITGASRGIGRQIALKLSSHGAAVILADLLQEDSETVAESIREQGGKALALQMDVGQPDQVESALARVDEHFERVDILVNNAGITRDNLLLRMKDEEWRQVLNVNLDGAFYVTRKVVAGMLRRRYGRVVNIASVVGQMGNPGQANYVASKAGIIGLTKALAREVASRSITVNAIAPGFIDTDMTANLKEQVRDQLKASVPLKRLGTVEDVTHGVLFLASKEAGYITGHVLSINGGMYM
jgi:3-oxoacyl-[acyl-carrier protein] reductase